MDSEPPTSVDDHESQATENPGAKTSPLYCDPEADATFISADGVIFKLHSIFFKAVSAGFDAPRFTIIDGPAVLTESADVLEILFQFIHPPFECEGFHQPALMNTEQSLFFKLATAAEKYVVYAAMGLCVNRMHYELYRSCPIQVLNHAANHGYNSLANKAAPHTMMKVSNPLQDALEGLTDPRVAVKWTKYYGHYLQISKIANELAGPSSNCSRYNEILVMILRNLAVNPTKPDVGLESEALPKSIGCSSHCDCYKIVDTFKALLKSKVTSIPKFSAIF